MADELTAAQTEELNQRLLAERDRLEERLKLTKDGARPVELSEPIGRLSRMDAIQQQQMAKANRATDERRLRLIEASIDALAKGEFGDCRSCEEPIGFARLSARPETPFCLECQEEREP